MRTSRPKTAKEKKAASKSMRAHWRKLRKMSANLGGTDLDVMNCVYPSLKLQGLVKGVLKKDRKSLAEAVDVIAELYPPRLSITYEKPKPNAPPPPVKSSPHVLVTPTMTEEQKVVVRVAALKIMLWSIKKIGSIEMARDAFERAARAVQDAAVEAPVKSEPVSPKAP